MRKLFFLLCALWTINANSQLPAILYVKADAKGLNNGTSWNNAFKNLQSALDVANSRPGIFNIWVAKGVYVPTKDESGNANPANPRKKTFLISKNVKLMGGFDGTETMECQQDYSDNETILSGDIGVPNRVTDNCYNVVIMRNVSDSSLLSGFTIKLGNGVGGTTFGGGLWIDGNNSSKGSNPTIEHCIFKNNMSTAGGAICCNGDGKNVSPAILHCTFLSNIATQSNGGAIYSSGRNGGNSKPDYEDCIFKGNKSLNDGGAIFNDAYRGTIQSDFVNCAFIGNVANRGGAIYNAGNAGTARANYKNCSFSGNSAEFDKTKKDKAYGGAIMNEAVEYGSSTDTVFKCILYGNSSELGFNGSPIVRVDTSLIKGGAASRGKGNANKDPLFVKQPPIGLGIEGDLNLKHESDLAFENMGYHEHGWNTDVHWTYSEEELEGPHSWLHLCSAKPGPNSCGGSKQSPIDIDTASVQNDATFQISERYEQHKIKVENNGHTLEFDAENDTLTLNGANYVLKQFHFHTPSEHKINGNTYPMEVHFVHLDTTTKQLTVLGVLFEIGTTEHPLLNTFIKNLPGKAAAKCDNDFEFSIENLLPENRECYQYKGSLTTPPCSEIVNWNVFKTPIKATQKQIDAFIKREHTNNRPTQDLNGRKIYSGKLISAKP